MYVDFLTSIMAIASCVGYWSVFQKMGYNGWEGLIPIYNTYILFKELMGNGWKMLLLLVPLYNIYLVFKFYITFVQSFQKPKMFAIGLIFMSPIFLCILGFDDSIYLRVEK